MPSLPRPLRRGTRSRALDATRPPEPDTPNLEILEAEGLRWINIVRPRPSDRAWLEEHFAFHPLDYEDVFSRNQRPKVDEYDDYLFVVLHFPRYDKTIGRLNAAELDVFIGPDFVITLPNETLQPLQYLWTAARRRSTCASRCSARAPATCSTRSSTTASTPRSRCSRRWATSSSASRTTSSRAARRGRARHLRRQAGDHQLPQDRPAAARALKDLERHKRYVSENLEVYFDDINDASERVWDMLENFKEVVEGLEGTNESVLSHRTNDVLRALTAFNVIILPLTFIASIFGMNVAFPAPRRAGCSGSSCRSCSSRSAAWAGTSAAAGSSDVPATATVTVIGTGDVGATVADLLVAGGHRVVLGRRRPDADLPAPLGAHREAGTLEVRTVAESALDVDVVFLAVPWHAAIATVEEAAPKPGTIVVDTTNYNAGRDGADADPGPAGTTAVLAERFADLVWVKSFNMLWAGYLREDADPAAPFRVVFVAADDAQAKATVATLVADAGFVAFDTGTLADAAARQLESSPAWNRQLDAEEAIRMYPDAPGALTP
jgi:magnesium transporter